MVLQSSYSSVSPALADWHTTVSDSNSAKLNIASAQTQIVALQSQINAWQAQVNQDTSDEFALLVLIRGFAQGHSLTDLSTQLAAYIAANPGS